MTLADETKTTSHEWSEVGANHWQIVTPDGESTDVTDAREGNRGACAAGMIEIKGKMRVTQIGDELQKMVCAKWINKDFPERCASFDAKQWATAREKLETKDMRFCIDRFEYPNKKDEYPLVFIDWNAAQKTCEGIGKRLCTEDEWTFACEGEEARPYPYGFDRDKDACVVDKPWKQFDPNAYGKKETLVRELDRLWQGAASGTQPRCKSPFGVYDMTGNVDEWTRSSLPGRKSILKGGYWGPVRTRCRPSTRAHGEDHAFYQQGLRCCKDL
ncbi:MAG TPA: SUMF1/EgtB/PvdO family nonheme iron enzyme [Labilithrix sp.]